MRFLLDEYVGCRADPVGIEEFFWVSALGLLGAVRSSVRGSSA